MAFSVCDVVRAAFMLRSFFFIFTRKKQTKRVQTRTKQTNYATESHAKDFVNAKAMQERNSARRVRHLLYVAFIYCNQYR